MHHYNKTTRFGYLCICLLFFLSGCADIETRMAELDAKILAKQEAGAKERKAEAEKARQLRAKKFRASETFKASQAVFAAHNPVVESRIGSLTLVTRMASEAEIPEDIYKLWAIFPAEGAGSLALGMVAPPMYASALVVGGIFLIPMGSYIYMHEKKIWESVNGALSTMAFTRGIDTAMTKRLGTMADRGFAEARVDVIVHGFGLVESTSYPYHCLVVTAGYEFGRKETPLTREQLQITPENRSQDAPPPQCTSLEHFADNDARLIRETLAEYVKVIASMVAERVLKEQLK